jgi:DNA-binding NarL/FixJ family response regulator
VGRPAAACRSERYRVVIVDDVLTLRALIRITLEGSRQFDVVAEGGTGREAVTLAEQHQPDVVLLDISMPVADGMQALPDVLRVAPGTRVVMLSGFQEQALGPLAATLGATGYLEKGLTPDELVDALLALVEAEA